MFSTKIPNINTLVTFGTAFAMAYILGTSVLKLIDHKMNDISINMPKINLPPPQINLYLKDHLGQPHRLVAEEMHSEDAPTQRQSGGAQISPPHTPSSKIIKFRPTNDKIQVLNQQTGGDYTSETYYRDPLQMTTQQLQKFMLKAQFSKMTLVDYHNWLNTFLDNRELLSEKFPEHLKNFHKMVSGHVITPADFQEVIPPKKTTETFVAEETWASVT